MSSLDKWKTGFENIYKQYYTDRDAQPADIISVGYSARQPNSMPITRSGPYIHSDKSGVCNTFQITDSRHTEVFASNCANHMLLIFRVNKY